MLGEPTYIDPATSVYMNCSLIVDGWEFIISPKAKVNRFYWAWDMYDNTSNTVSFFFSLSTITRWTSVSTVIRNLRA